ncbi:hypothetical protein CRYUN_Cryun28dG0086700 [Craigia yunnanensis]
MGHAEQKQRRGYERRWDGSAYKLRFTEEIRVFKIEKDENYSGNHVTNTMMRTSSRNKINLSHDIYGADHDALNAFEYDTNDFHPTSPGHSPSVGHSTPPAASNDHH